MAATASLALPRAHGSASRRRRSRYEQGRVLARRGAPGDHARALELLAASARSAAALGMPALAESALEARLETERAAAG